MALLVVLSGCPADPGSVPDDGLDDPFIAGRQCDEDSVLTWQSWGQPFLPDHCTGCHGSAVEEEHRSEAPWDVDFDTVEMVREHLDMIYRLTADANDSMPPVDSLADADRERLADWLACGAP